MAASLPTCLTCHRGPSSPDDCTHVDCPRRQVAHEWRHVAAKLERAKRRLSRADAVIAAGRAVALGRLA